MTCSCSPVYVIRIVRYRRRTEKKSAHSSSSSSERERLKRKHEREIESKNERTIYTINAPVMVTVLVLLCFEENVACGTTLSPEPTKFVARCWCRAWCCSLPPPVPPPEVLFIVVLLFSFSCNYELCDGETKKKTETQKKRSLGFIRYPKYTFSCVVPAFLSFSDCCFRLILSYRLVGGVTI